MSDAATVNFTAKQGATFRRLVSFFDSVNAPVDVSAWGFRGQVRHFYDSEGIMEDFVFSAGPMSHQIYAEISDEDMEDFAIPASGDIASFKVVKYLYDWFADLPDGTVDAVFQGTFTVTPSVTKGV